MSTRVVIHSRLRGLFVRWILLVAVLLPLPTTATASDAAAGAVGGMNYQWSAAIEPSTGIATSRERSHPPACHSRMTTRAQRHAFLQAFLGYPQWLARPRVTFGMIQAQQNHTDGSTTIYLRSAIWNSTILRRNRLALLSFGQPQRHVRHRGDRKQNTPEITSILLPITGGILAQPTTKTTMTTKVGRRSRSTPGTAIRSHEVVSYGSLLFSLHQAHNQTIVAVETNIQDGYRPTLAGRRLPLSILQARMYQSTQSLVHAYVMWRFHKYCYASAAAASATSACMTSTTGTSTTSPSS
jgi:hypothetical protein